MPLSSLKIKSGNWEFGADFRDITVAHDWGKSPSEFWELPEKDKIVMIAWSEARNEMSAYDAQIEEARMKKPGDG